MERKKHVIYTRELIRVRRVCGVLDAFGAFWTKGLDGREGCNNVDFAKDTGQEDYYG